MNRPDTPDREQYFQAAESWAADRAAELTASRRIAWIVAGVAAAIAVLEAIALVLLTPMKTVVPYTLLVDRQTGHVEALDPLERETVSPDRALVRSFLVQYVIARESFDIDSLNDTYRKVALWSAEEARSRYLAEMQASNPLSPLASLPRRALLEVQVRSVSSLDADTSMVRFTTIRRDPGGQPQEPRYWAAVLTYRFSGAAMSAEDRMINPLGFQVVRYRRDAETLPEVPVVRSVIGDGSALGIAPDRARNPAVTIPNVRQPRGAPGGGPAQ
jgi:type IV secretion system protein VirB8